MTILTIRLARSWAEHQGLAAWLHRRRLADQIAARAVQPAKDELAAEMSRAGLVPPASVNLPGPTIAHGIIVTG